MTHPLKNGDHQARAHAHKPVEGATEKPQTYRRSYGTIQSLLLLKKRIEKLVGLRDLHTTVLLLIFMNAIAGVWGILLDRKSLKSTRFFWAAIVALKLLSLRKLLLGSHYSLKRRRTR